MKLPVSQSAAQICFHWGRNTPGVSQTQIEMSVDEPVAIFEAAITRSHLYLEENQIYFFHSGLLGSALFISSNRSSYSDSVLL